MTKPNVIGIDISHLDFVKGLTEYGNYIDNNIILYSTVDARDDHTYEFDIKRNCLNSCPIQLGYTNEDYRIRFNFDKDTTDAYIALTIAGSAADYHRILSLDFYRDGKMWKRQEVDIDKANYVLHLIGDSFVTIPGASVIFGN